MLRVEALAVSAGDAPLSFEISNGQTLGLLGANTDGLLRVVEAIAGLRAAVAGNIRIDDLDVLRDSAAARALVSICLPRAANGGTSLRDHAGVVAASRRARLSARDGIARLGLDARLPLNAPAARSAAGLLAALIPDVPVVLLHEPFRDLADETRAKAIDWIRELGGSGTCVLITGREERDVRAVSHQVIETGAGR